MQFNRSTPIFLLLVPLFSLAASAAETNQHQLADVKKVISPRLVQYSRHKSVDIKPKVKMQNIFKSCQTDQDGALIEAVGNQPRQTVNIRLLASTLLDQGNTKSSSDEYESAKHYYLESAKIAEDAGLYTLAIKAYSNAARVDLLQDNRSSAGILLRSAHQHIPALSESREKVELQLGLGRLFLDKGLEILDSEMVFQLLDEARQISEKLRFEDLESYALGYLGALYLSDKRNSDASELTNRAEFLAQSLNRPDILFRWQWQNGRILAKQGLKGQAITAYQHAISTLQPLRGAQRALLAAAGSSANFDDLYIEYADLLLQNDKLPENRLLSVRDLIEQGKVAELEDYYHDDCVAAWLSKATRIDRLAEHTAALYPIMFPNRLELLLSLPQGLRRYTVPEQDRAAVRKRVEQLRGTLENRATPEYLPHAQALYNLLIKPIQVDLIKHHIDTLVFIPYATFRTIPLAALHDGQDFLIKRYAVSTSPGLTLTDPHPLQSENSRVLLAGLSESSQGFQALPNVRAELRQVAEQFPATILENQTFRTAKLKQHLQENPYRIVHIASHGQFSRNITNTFVLTTDGKISLDTLGKMMGVSRYRNEPIELLTLSACQTAAGDDRAALGLAGVAVKAGARSALASLWFINDPASAELISEFYRQLRIAGTSKAKALQAAQKLLLNDERYEHPSYWAPFLMIGNWL
jgi:CHAT domain-containing protein